jgi:putative inorganic carbon (HCO3(-)) transporter
MLNLLLPLIFLRPFISSLAFPYLNSLYSCLLLLALAILIAFKGLKLDNIRPLKSPILLFIFALFISTAFSRDKINSLNQVYIYATDLILFIIAASKEIQARHRLIQTIVFSGLIISILAMYQYFFGFSHTKEFLLRNNIVASGFTWDYIQEKRAFFPFITPNALGGYLAMILPLVFIKRVNSWMAIPLFAALLLTKSLGGFLSLIVALIIIIYLQNRLSKKGVILTLGLLIAILIIFWLRSATAKQHIHPFFSTIMRINYWRETLEIIKGSPLTGVGLGNFNLPQSRYAHNSYLQLWAETGILGLISFLWLIGKVIKTGLKKLKENPYRNEIIFLVFVNLIFLIHNFLDFTFFLPEISLIWWLILGLCM